MGDHPEDAVAAAFDAYVDRLACVMGHACRVRALKEYCTGLLVAEGRKSVEPLAAAVRPDRVAASGERTRTAKRW
jgi:SRSO17 transposase